MKIFLLKSICIAALMFISVLAGMQMANGGIQKIKEFKDPNFQNTVLLEGKSSSLKENEVRNDSSSHDLHVKQQKLEKINSFNLFSAMGKTMAEGISKTSEKIINSIAN